MNQFWHRSKHRNVPTQIDGIRFASKHEAARYAELALMVQSGAIRNLQTHPRFRLEVNGVDCGSYVADFQYDEYVRAVKNWQTVVEDAKGFDRRTKKFRTTDLYRLKKKLMFALFTIRIREV